MAILQKTEIRKFHLEKKLIELERMNEYGDKARLINSLLTSIIDTEKKTGDFCERVNISDYDYNLIFNY